MNRISTFVFLLGFFIVMSGFAQEHVAPDINDSKYKEMTWEFAAKTTILPTRDIEVTIKALNPIDLSVLHQFTSFAETDTIDSIRTKINAERLRLYPNEPMQIDYKNLKVERARQQRALSKEAPKKERAYGVIDIWYISENWGLYLYHYYYISKEWDCCMMTLFFQTNWNGQYHEVYYMDSNGTYQFYKNVGTWDTFVMYNYYGGVRDRGLKVLNNSGYTQYTNFLFYSYDSEY